jgi:protein-S-isoprenylcysteine O-methyltransferase Ste14
MSELGFKIIFMVLYIAAAVGRAPFAAKVKKMMVEVSRKSGMEIFILISTIPFMILPLFYVFSTWIDYFNWVFPVWIRIIGGVGFFAAIFMHNWSHIALGTNWSYTLELKKEQKLITRGPYKHIRHPMYTAFLLWVVFQSLLLPNWLILLVGLFGIAMMYFGRVKKEEELMIERFGDEYREYMKRTGRLFPIKVFS